MASRFMASHHAGMTANHHPPTDKLNLYNVATCTTAPDTRCATSSTPPITAEFTLPAHAPAHCGIIGPCSIAAVWWSKCIYIFPKQLLFGQNSSYSCCRTRFSNLCAIAASCKMRHVVFTDSNQLQVKKILLSSCSFQSRKSQRK